MSLNKPIEGGVIFKGNEAGVTLIELLIAVVILSVIFGFGVPSYIILRDRTSLDSARQSLASSITLARSSAISTSNGVTVCGSTNGSTCDEPVNWNNGWIVFDDEDQDGALDANGIVHYSENVLHDDLTVIQNFDSGQLRFDRQGHITPPAVYTATLCVPSGVSTIAKRVVVTAVGGIATIEGDEEDCAPSS